MSLNNNKKYKEYFSRLFYLEEYSVKNIINKIEQGFYYSKYAEQKWKFMPKKSGSKWIVFVSHEVAGIWSTWLWDESGAKQFLYFKTKKEAAEYFIEYVMNETDFYDVGVFSQTSEVLIEKI